MWLTSEGHKELIVFGLSIWKILFLGTIVFLVFGRRRLPELGRSVGETMKEFKKGLNGESPRDVTHTAKRDDDDSEPKS